MEKHRLKANLYLLLTSIMPKNLSQSSNPFTTAASTKGPLTTDLSCRIPWVVRIADRNELRMLRRLAEGFFEAFDLQSPG